MYKSELHIQRIETCEALNIFIIIGSADMILLIFSNIVRN